MFGGDKNYAYNVREKCLAQGIEITYLSTIYNLIAYIINNSAGLIFIDLKYARFVPLLSDYCYKSGRCDFIIVYLDDNKKSFFECQEPYSFVSNIDNLSLLIPKLLNAIKQKQNSALTIPQHMLYEYTTELLRKFRISPKMQGYSYIKKCVDVGIKSDEKFLNFSRNIYPSVADEYKTTVGNVEKSIRDVLDSSISQSPEIFDIHEFQNKNVTNATFLTYLIVNVKLKFLESVYN